MISLGLVKGMVAALVVISAGAAWQTHQLARTETKLAECKLDVSEMRSALVSANNEMLRRVADAGRMARDEYDRKMRETGPLVEGVRVRITDLCLPKPTAPDRVRGAVPATPGLVDGANTESRSDRDGDTARDRERTRFVEALQRDIEYCQKEVNRLDAFQNWAKKVTCNTPQGC